MPGTIKMRCSEFEHLKEMSFYNNLIYKHIPTGELYKEWYKDDEPYAYLYVQKQDESGTRWEYLGFFEWDKGLRPDLDIKDCGREYLELILD